MTVRDSFIPSHAGPGSIRIRTWTPDSAPVGVLQLAHGVAEHIERYGDFAAFLVSKGFLVVGNDHAGHGRSVLDTKGWFAEKNGWQRVVADMKSVYDLYSGDSLPYFMLGHSMGAFLLRSFLITYPDQDLAGAVLSGTGTQSAVNLAMGGPICAVERARLGSRGVSKLINALAMGGYNKKIPNPKTKNDWLCQDERVVAAYEADELCGFDMTVGLAKDMIDGIKQIQKPSNLAEMNKALPVLFISGAMDPVGGYGKGARRVFGLFEKAGMKDLEMKVYPGVRHEVLNELNKTEVYADVWNWVCKRMNAPAD